MNARNEDRQLQIYRKLVEIAGYLASTLDLETLLMRIVEAAVDLSNAEAASILLYDHQHKELSFQASTDIENASRLKGIVVPKESIAGWVAQECQPLVVSDVHSDERFFQDVEKKLDFPTQSILAIPMIVKDKLVGVLEAINKKQGQFTEEDLINLQVLASQAAVAIENSRLFHQSDAISELVHEVRTPLSSVNTMAFLLQRADLDETQRIKYAQSVQREVLRLVDLVNNFLNLSRLESGRAEYHIARFDLVELMDECVQVTHPNALEKLVELSLETKTPLFIQADRNQIKQVILNLLSNAIKFNHPGGKVFLRGWQTDQSVGLEVQDTGRGIPQESQSHLFEKFYRVPGLDRTESGTGLGLSICKKIIENHGGIISFSSEAGKGTTFKISLPLEHQKNMVASE